MHLVRLRQHLQALHDVLARSGETLAARQVLHALSQADPQLEIFLLSNDLWGGSGSIADQAGCGLARASRRSIESALIDLGEAQLGAGLANIRTKGWVEAFRSSQNQGI